MHKHASTYCYLIVRYRPRSALMGLSMPSSSNNKDQDGLDSPSHARVGFCFKSTWQSVITSPQELLRYSPIGLTGAMVGAVVVEVEEHRS